MPNYLDTPSLKALKDALASLDSMSEVQLREFLTLMLEPLDADDMRVFIKQVVVPHITRSIGHVSMI